MGTPCSARHLSWQISCSCRKRGFSLEPKTGLVSPQFHLVFDDDFTTVPHLRKGTVPSNWAKLVEGSREKSTEEFYDLTKTWFDSASDETAGENIEIDSTSN